MATRATYGFHASGKPDITIYIHHDGYEAGAGSYIAKAFAEGGETLNDYFTVESFIRANYRAEITESHDSHSDTEYRYDFYPGDNPAHQNYGIITLDSTVIVGTRKSHINNREWSETTWTVRELLLGFGQVPTVKAIEPEGFAA